MSRRFVLLAAALGVLIVVSSPAAAQQPTQQAQTITADWNRADAGRS
jgi:hypothetical protein